MFTMHTKSCYMWCFAVIGILALVDASVQNDDYEEQLTTNAIGLRIEDDVLHFETQCHSTTMCTTCATKSFFSEMLQCDDDDQVCNFHTMPQSWNTGCNLRNLFDSLPFWSKNTSTPTFWYPGRRFSDFGPYQHVSAGSTFGTDVSNVSFTDVYSFYRKDCLVVDASTDRIFPEFCGSIHAHKCSISATERNDFCAYSCVYCSESYTCYTNRGVCHNKQFFPWGYYVPSYACPVCLRSFDYCPSRVRMVLSFNRRLYLTIYYPECLYNKGNSRYIYCFTDASEQLRKRVDVELLHSHIKHPYPSQHNFMVYQVELEEFMGQYWCEAFGSTERSRDIYTSNTVIAYENANGNEFAVRLVVHDICNRTSCADPNNIDFLIEDVTEPIERDDFAVVRLMRINELYLNSHVDLIVHVSTLSRRSETVTNYYTLKALVLQYPSHISVSYVRSSERCIPQVYRNLTWPLARRSQTVLPEELCLQANGSPVTRFCDGDFLTGLRWREVDGECSDDSNLNAETLLLQSFLNQDISKEVILNVSEVVHTGNLTLIDLYVVQQFLERSSELAITTSILNASLDVLSELMSTDTSLLVKAQDRLNITDSYLRASETIALNYTTSSLLTILKSNLIFHSFNPIAQQRSGFVLYNNYTILPIPLLGTLYDVSDTTDVKMALHLSSEDIQTIVANNLTKVSVVALIYLNDHFFPSDISSSADMVVNLNLPNYEHYLKNPVPLLVRSELNTSFDCAFWDYGDVQEQRRGNWSSTGSTYRGNFDNYSHLQMCSYSHLTHLALLVLNKQNDAYLEGTNDHVLSIITAVGSFLSILGIVGIFVTSCMFRFWRDKTGTQILLHLSVATLFEIVFMYLNGFKLFDCTLAGVVLQYLIISKFAWMLIYAFCQYLRFVRVFGPMPHHLVFKSILFGWGFGVVPTAAVFFSDPTTYFREKFCYPKGIYLFLGLYLPVAVAVLINFAVFCRIMCEVTKTSLNKTQSARMTMQQVKLAVLLFSVLGIPWLFGFISNVMPWDWLKLICIYVFTVTSILQGFLMFLFYVIFNKETRESWKRIFLPEKRSYLMFSSKKSNSISSIS